MVPSLRFACFFLLTIACSIFITQPLHAQTADQEDLVEQAYKQATALAGESVVRIETVGGLDRVGQVLTGTGPTSGVVVSEDGFIISSAFNFISKPASILVRLQDGRRFPARQISRDLVRMLVLLKIDVNGLKPIQAVPENELRVGQWALALGRTYDLRTPNVSVGIVSALNRIWGKAIQTDAKVSPVNYGGPLIDIRGRAQGILVPLSPRDTGETAGIEWYDSGIGFAIPMEVVYRNLERMQSGEDLKPGLMGISLKSKNPYATEVILDRVRYDSPAEKAGLKVGDRIVEMNGEPVVRQTQVRTVLGSRYAGETISLAVKRDDKTIDAELQLVDKLPPWESGFLGILPQRFAADAHDDSAVIVRHVFADSPAAQAGLKPGDAIVKFQEQPVTTTASLLDLVSRIRPGEDASLVFRRGDDEKNVTLELASIPNEIVGRLKPVLIPPADVSFEAIGKKDDGNSDEEGADGDNTEEKNDAEKGDKENSDGESDTGSANSREKFRTGRFNDSLPSGDRDYWAYVPEDFNPAFQYGLIVWLQPGGDTMEADMLKAWKSQCDQRGFILLGPKAANAGGWGSNEADAVLECVKRIREQYPVDARRICVQGFRSGGQFALYLGFKFREEFPAIQPIAAGLRQPPAENRPDFRQQLHFLCGKKDNAFRQVDATVKGLRRMKFPTALSAKATAGREFPSSDQIDEAARWLDSLDRI